MIRTLQNAWRTKEIRGKILFTLFILLLYRIGTVIPVPFINATTFEASFSGTILDYLNTLSGGSLGTATLFALGVSPYINASIIMQLLGVVFPKLGEMAKDDKKRYNFIMRAATVVLALVTAIGYYFLLKNNGSLTNAAMPGDNRFFWIYGIAIVLCYCAGASVIMWLADRINENGIGNGISLILFANIISSVPSFAINLVRLVVGTYTYQEKPWLYGIVSTVFALTLIAVVIALVVLVIWVTGSERRIPVQYAKRVVGRKMYGGQSSNLPLKVNMVGVMPIIFASSLVTLIPTILQLFGVSPRGTGFWSAAYRVLGSDGVVYPVCLFLFIIGFSYFYTMITFDPMEVANNLKKQGGTIPGIRQGKPTADYIRKSLNKITLVGALFLGFIALLPAVGGPHVIKHILEWLIYSPTGMNAATIENYATMATQGGYYYYIYSYYYALYSQVNSLTSVFTFGGTTLLIVVGVAIETFRELEAQLTMRNYNRKGFLN